MSESALQRSILDALKKMPGIVAWRCNSGGRRGRMHGAPAGTADIVGAIAGRFFGIECKAQHKDNCICKHCTAQRAWGTRVSAIGGIYVRARSLDDVLRGLGIT